MFFFQILSFFKNIFFLEIGFPSRFKNLLFSSRFKKYTFYFRLTSPLCMIAEFPSSVKGCVGVFFQRPFFLVLSIFSMTLNDSKIGIFKINFKIDQFSSRTFNIFSVKIWQNICIFHPQNSGCRSRDPHPATGSRRGFIGPMGRKCFRSFRRRSAPEDSSSVWGVRAAPTVGSCMYKKPDDLCFYNLF